MKYWLKEIRDRIKYVATEQWYDGNIGNKKNTMCVTITPTRLNDESPEYGAQRLADLLSTYIAPSQLGHASLDNNLVQYYVHNSDILVAALFVRWLQLIRLYDPNKTYTADAIKQTKAVLPKPIFEALEMNTSASDQDDSPAANSSTEKAIDNSFGYIIIILAVIALLWILVE